LNLERVDNNKRAGPGKEGPGIIRQVFERKARTTKPKKPAAVEPPLTPSKVLVITMGMAGSASPSFEKTTNRRTLVRAGDGATTDMMHN